MLPFHTFVSLDLEKVENGTWDNRLTILVKEYLFRK